MLQPARELARRGHTVFQHVAEGEENAAQGNIPVQNVIPKDLGGDLGGFDADVYVLQRRFEYGIPTAILKLRQRGKAVVVETDDLYDGLPESSPGWKVLRDHPNRISVDVLNVSMKCADAVTVSTEALAEHYSRFQPNIHVLPNYLDWPMWADVEQQSEVERPKLRVGWMGWLAWRDNDLHVLRDVLPGFLRRHRDVEFVSVGEPAGAGAFKPGHVSVHKHLGIPAGQRRTVHGVPYRRLAEIVPTIDIGLVPLDRNPFNECKSYLKGLEYAACGIPCVATPTGPYRGFVRDGEDGLLPSTPAEWLAALELLVSDDALRRRMGRAARAKAETMTIQKEAWRWEQLYQGLVSSRSASSTASTTATSACSSVAPVLAG